MKKVLHVTNLYPSREKPNHGRFILDQIKSIDQLDGTILSTVMYIDRAKFGMSSYIYALVRVWWMKNKYDVIHAHHLFSSVVVILAGAHRKLVTSYLSDGPNEMMTGPMWLRRAIFSMSRKLSSKKIFKLMPAGGLQRHEYYIPNGVDFSTFTAMDRMAARRALSLESDENYVLFVSGGHLHRPEKRYDLFLEIVDELNRRGHRVKALAIADEPRDIVHLHYSASNVYVLTSDFEGSPNAVKEALSCDRPVVARRVGSVPDLLAGIPGCFVVDSGSPESYLEPILDAIKYEPDGAIRGAFKEKNLGLSLVAENVRKIYEEL